MPPSRASQLHSVEPDRDEFDGIIEDCAVLVPPGRYTLAYTGYRTAKFFGSAKVILSLAVIHPDDYAGIPLERFYNVEGLIGPVGEKGRFKAPARGHLAREYHALMGKSPRRDRITFGRLEGKRILGDVETVARDHAGKQIPPEASYSRVARLISCLPELA